MITLIERAEGLPLFL